jgi:glycosyltransferase involved in cell wall biosynthesis
LPRKLVLWTLANSDEVVTLTKFLWDKLLQAGLKQRQVNVIPHGVDTLQFEYSVRPLSRPIAFLHIANLHPVKDQLTLLRAFKIISNKVDATLKIVGEGILAQEIRKLVFDLGLNGRVAFVGALPYGEIPYHYSTADFLLHTSLSEGQSVVANEAMSSGVIVCGTAVGLLYDEPRLCISVEVSDYENLALKVLQLLDDPGRMNQLKRDGYRWATAHDLNWTTQRYAALYDQSSISRDHRLK